MRLLLLCSLIPCAVWAAFQIKDEIEVDFSRNILELDITGTDAQFGSSDNKTYSIKFIGKGSTSSYKIEIAISLQWSQKAYEGTHLRSFNVYTYKRLMKEPDNVYTCHVNTTMDAIKTYGEITIADSDPKTWQILVPFYSWEILYDKTPFMLLDLENINFTSCYDGDFEEFSDYTTVDLHHFSGTYNLGMFTTLSQLNKHLTIICKNARDLLNNPAIHFRLEPRYSISI